MRSLVVIVATLIMFTVVILMCLWSFRLGVRSVAKEDVAKHLRPLRMTKHDVVLYRKAARLLNRLINITDLDGDLAGDIVSDTTRRQIEVWLIEYKEELDKV